MLVGPCRVRRRCYYLPANALAVASLVSFFLLVIFGILHTNIEDAKFSSVQSKEEEEINSFFNKMKLRMRNRTKAVDVVCSQHGAGRHHRLGRKPSIMYPPSPNYENFIFDLKDKLAWCPVYKAASTSWFYNLGALAGWTEQQMRDSNTQISNLMKTIYPPLSFEDGAMAIYKSRIKFFIVRHPFVRILSAYRDKLENRNTNKEHGSEHFYQAYGQRMVKKYRNKPILQEIDSNSFRDLQMYVENDTNKTGDAYTPPPAPDGTEPSFLEFVRYLIDVSFANTDDHWLPFYLSCAPCTVTYDVIAKFETLGEDTRYIILKLNLQDKLKPTWKHVTNGKETSQVLKKYFSTIPKFLLLKLYEKYKVDFEMFGYNIKEYLTYYKT